MSGHYIHIDLDSELDADRFEDLTTSFHQDFRPSQQLHAINGAGPKAPYRRVSRAGFMETVLEMAGQEPRMTAVACVDRLGNSFGEYGLECFVTAGEHLPG